MKIPRRLSYQAKWVGRLIVLGIAFGIASTCFGDQTFYIGPNNGLWTNGTNWDAGVVPPSGSDVIIGQFIPSRMGDVSVTFDGNYPDLSSALNSLKLDANGSTGMIVINQLSGASAMFALNQYVGVGGRAAQYNQSAGINRLGQGSLYLGFDAGSAGNYVLSNTGSLGGGDFFAAIYVGFSGSGVFSQNGGTINVAKLHLAETANSNGNYTLAGGELKVTGANNDATKEIIGAGASATFVQTGGIHTIGEFSNGHFTLGIGDGSSYSLSGGTLNLVGGAGDGNPGGKLGNEGTFTISSGSFVLTKAGAFINNYGPPDGNGVFNYSGGSISFPNGGTIDNSGTFNITVPLGTLPVNVTNSGVFHITAGTISFGDTFTNNNVYISSAPARQNYGTLTIGNVGYLQGGAGDVFDLGRNLTNNSAKPTEFNMSKCWLVLSGSGVTHRVAWPGADIGAVVGGYTNNFAIGVLKLASGNSLTLLDGNGTAGGAIYVEVLQLDGGVSQIANISSSGGMTIYYDPNNSANNYLQGATYQLNGGGVIAPVPNRTPPAEPTPSPTPIPPARTLNISTRLRVESGNNVLIGGFIITGNASKNVAIRGLGPSLTNSGITDVLSDPKLELRSSNSALVSQNNDWQDDSSEATQLTSLGLALPDPKESGIVAALQPAAYTAILSGNNQGTGVGLVEIYDINNTADSRLANISTRGFVQTGNNVMIGGFILGGNANTRIVVRGIGPSLAQFGLTPVLLDPTLELHDGNGALLVLNDDWQDDTATATQLTSLGLAPSNSKESGVFRALPPGAFTAILAGKNGGTGIGLVEIYNAQ
jgi:hypothetical protein